MENYMDETFWECLRSGKFASMVKESSKGQTISNSQEVYNVLKPMMAGHDDVEVLYGIFLDSKNHVIAIEQLFSGTITGTSVYPREIVKKVLEHKASALVLAHNHPSGVPDPSLEDKDITVRIAFVMNAIGVALHDHTIIGTTYHSMADNGFIRGITDKLKDIFTSVRCV